MLISKRVIYMTQQPKQHWQKTIVLLFGKLHSLQCNKSARQSHIVSSAPCCAWTSNRHEFLNAIVVRRGAVLSQGGERLSSAAGRCWQSSKPERASLFPIKSLSLSSRHWQHREKRKNSPSGIHLPSLLCLGTLPLSPLHTHTHTHTHIPKHIVLSWLHADGHHELID